MRWWTDDPRPTTYKVIDVITIVLGVMAVLGIATLMYCVKH